MKKLISIFLLFYFCLNVLAEDTLIINQTITLDSEFSDYDDVLAVARDSITLEPGFEFSADTNSNFSTLLDPWDLDAPEQDLAPGTSVEPTGILDGSYVVGSITGKPGVSSTGAATYSIPISVPAGTKGMIPQLAIGYSSQSGNGIMGRGWHLSGLSSIVATGKTKYYDNESTAISSTDTACRVVWDGQRLFAVDSIGLAADTFRTEIFSNAEIIKNTEPSYVWFEVKMPNGRTLEYGNTTDSRMELDDNTRWKWMLNKAYDRDGNAILYSYDTDEDICEILLSEIQYGGVTSTSPVNTISLHYAARSDLSYAYIHDDLIVNNKVLDSISIESKNTYYGSYGFHYDDTSGETLLEEVFQYDKDNNSFNPTVIEWDAPTISYSPSGQTESINTQTGFTYHSGDFTGDGISDMVAVDINNNQYHIYKGSSTGLTYISSKELPHSFTCQFWEDIRTSFDGEGCSINPSSLFIADEITYVFSGDFDGDGIQELFVKVMEWDEMEPYLPSDLNSDFTSTVVLEDNLFEDELCNFIPEIVTGNPDMEYGTGCILNFDDNVADSDTLLRFKLGGNPDYDIQYTPFPDLDGRGFCSIPDEDYVYYFDPREVSMDQYCSIPDNPSIWGEFNGDGKADYIDLGYAGWKVKTYNPSNNGFSTADTFVGTYLGMIDLNGDGINAYVALGPEQFDMVPYEDLWDEWCPGNTTSCDISVSIDWYSFLSYYGLTNEYVDFLDYYSLSDVDTSRTLFLENNSLANSLGYELYAKHLSGHGVDISFGLFEGTHTSEEPMFTRALNADINGDGKSELLIFDEDSLLMIYHDFEANNIHGELKYMWSTEYCNYAYGDNLTFGDYNGDGIVDILFPESDIMLTFATGKPGKYMSSITNGMGIQSRYTYKPMTDSDVYTAETDASFPVIDISIPWYLVSSVSSDNGVADSLYLEYEYEGAKMHVQGKGFLGFMKTTRENALLNTSQISNLAYDTTYFNSYPVSTVQKVGTITVARSTIYTSIENVTGLTYSVQTDSIVKSDTLSGTTNTTRYSYNTSNGLIIEKETQVDNVATITQNYTYVDAGWHVAALPEYVTTTYNRNGVPERDSSVFSYSSSGNLIQKIEFYGSPMQVTTKFNDYDSFGNPTKTSVTAKRGPNLSLDSVVSEITYDSDGRFMLSKSDPLDFKKSYDFDLTTGTLQSSTAANRTETTYEYGPFNRAESSASPNMIQKSSLIFWANDHDDAPTDALYYKWASASGVAPILTFYDATGRELRSVTSGFSNETIYSDTEYDSKGRLLRKSLPYFNNDTIWATYSYDAYGRVLTETSTDTTLTTYDYDPLETTITIQKGNDLITTRTKVNALGETIESEDNLGNVVYYAYYPDGKLDSSYVSAHTSKGTSFTYDNQGNRTSITDPDAGTISSSYDSFGQLIQQISAIGDTSSYEYDRLGRVTKSTDQRGSIYYSYLTDTTEACFGLVDSIYNADKSLTELYTYDPDYGMLLTQTRTQSGKSFTNSYSYDWFGRPVARTYPSGFEVQYSYNSNGHLDKVTGEGYTLWNCSDVNAFGQVTSYSQGSNSTTVTYNMHGELNTVKTGSIREMYYGFDNLGNLSFRKDTLTNQMEVFEYDSLNRLTGIDYYLNDSHQAAYDFITSFDDCGNIISKTGVSSTINYGGTAGPHALTSIETPEADYKPVPQNISYNCFNKVSSITDTLTGGVPLTLDFTYGLSYQRIKMVRTRNSSVERVKYYDGDYEEDSTATGVKKYHYIQGGSGLTAIFVMNGSGNDTMYYVLSDHLGSMTTIVNATTSEVENYSFNAWGVPRDASDWTQSASNDLFADRGFTGHEHLPEFNLINMNGRIYDPILGRFLSPDPYVQSPGYPNNYNRYTYCLNNPLIYTDPDGEFFLGTAITFVVDFLKTVLTEGVLDPWNTKENRQAAWRDFDPTASWSKTNKAWNIDIGIFNAGEDANFSDKLSMGLERSFSLLFWGGNVAAHYHNLAGNVESVDRFFETTVLNLKPYSINSRAFHLGGYIYGTDVGTSIEYVVDSNGNIKLDSDGNPTLTASSSLVIHEYGHYLQQEAYLNDPIAYILMGINSSRHNFEETDWKAWAEKDADYRSLEHFSSIGYSMNGYKWEDAILHDVPYYKVYFYSWAHFVWTLFGIE